MRRALASLFALSLVACGGPSTIAPGGTCSAGSAGSGHAAAPSASSSSIPDASPGGLPAPSVDDARAFLAHVDKELRRLWVADARATWVNEVFITDDTDQIAASTSEASMAFLGSAMVEAKRYMSIPGLPADLARQLYLLSVATSMPGPGDPTRRAELAKVGVELRSEYGKGQYCPPKSSKLARKDGQCLHLEDLDEVLGKERDPALLLEAWKAWHDTAAPQRKRYERFVALSNEGAKALGWADTGELWRAGYDMKSADFEQEVERLWTQMKPLYEELHCYARKQLRAKYGEKLVPKTGPIPAHLLGNMWAQEWDYIYPLVEPYAGQPSIDVGKAIVGKKLTPVDMVKIGERAYTSLGFDPLPKTFWERSLFTRPKDREVQCHAEAMDVTFDDDLRIKMCVHPTGEDLVTIHHELGHDYYFHSYHTLPMLYQNGANDGFHEGIGDTLALSVTPTYLKSLGLLAAVPKDDKGTLNVMMKLALGKTAFLPFGLLVDKWRWDVFSGKLPKERWNAGWWELRAKYQGVSAPVARSEADFDPGAKMHVASNTPYMRYFLATIYQFQFHRALCKIAGHTGPLHTCSIFGNKAAGEKLKSMLALGASKPWPEALATLSGETKADATAMIEYFAPLRALIRERTKGETCGY